MIRLKLVRTKACLDTLLEEGAQSELSFLNSLDKVIGDEVAAKDAKWPVLRTQLAKFPLGRTLESYDSELRPRLDRRLMVELETVRYLANAINILLLRPPGVGKTHLAIGLGRNAIQQGYGCRLITALDLVQQLTLAEQRGALDDALDHFAKPHLQILDLC